MYYTTQNVLMHRRSQNWGNVYKSMVVHGCSWCYWLSVLCCCTCGVNRLKGLKLKGLKLKGLNSQQIKTLKGLGPIHVPLTPLKGNFYFFDGWFWEVSFDSRKSARSMRVMVLRLWSRLEFEIDASSIKREKESSNDPALLSASINEMDSAFVLV